MNSERTKLRQDQRSEQEQTVTQQSAHTTGLEFSTVEDLLRHDSDMNPVPAEVADRVNASISAEPKPKKPWYKTLFR